MLAVGANRGILGNIWLGNIFTEEGSLALGFVG